MPEREQRLTFGSLFSGIGGMDLGLERAGMECRWQVEIDPFCQRVLTKHWPEVPKYGDITQLTGSELERVDVIAGGFPCQPVSYAGLRQRQADSRWLWPNFARLVGILRPAIVLLENVPGLLTGGMGRVAGDLACLGYDLEWDTLPAASFGAPHLRNRLFVIATAGKVHNAYCFDPGSFRRSAEAYRRWSENPSERPRLYWGAWAREPGVARVAYGIPNRLDRLKGCGNAVVPQVAEWIGRRILEIHSAGRGERV